MHLYSSRSSLGSANEAWLDLGLLDSLAALSAGTPIAQVQRVNPVWALLEEPLQACPELLLCGMAAVRGEWGSLQREVRLIAAHQPRDKFHGL